MTEQQKKTVGVAIASLVLGISGFVIGLLGAVPAVICGHIAKSKIKKDPENLAGDGMALAGLLMGYIQIAMIPILIAIAIPAFVKAKTRAQEIQTRASMAKISIGIDIYEIDTGKWPSSLSSLVENDGSERWGGPYLNSRESFVYQNIKTGDIGFMDSWGTPFVYQVDEQSFNIISAGPDRILDTSDDIESP